MLLKRQSIDLHEVALAHVEALQAAAPQRRVRAQVQDEPQASGAPWLLRELMHELLDNAWRPTAGLALVKLDVGSSTGADGVCITCVTTAQGLTCVTRATCLILFSSWSSKTVLVKALALRGSSASS